MSQTYNKWKHYPFVMEATAFRQTNFCHYQTIWSINIDGLYKLIKILNFVSQEQFHCNVGYMVS